jgi:subfamily B ATP-binding cassette protein MsbA
MASSSSLDALNQKKISDKILAQRILQDYIWPYRWLVALALLSMMIAAGSTAYIAKLVKPIIDDVFIQKDTSQLWHVSFMIIIAFSLKGIATYGESYYMNFVGQRLITDLQQRIIAVLMKGDLSFFSNHPTGDLISRSVNDVSMMRHAFSFALVGAGKYFITLIFLMILMFYEDWILALISFFAFPAALYPIVRLGKRLRKASTYAQQEVSRLMTLMTQVFQGIRLVKAYGMENHEQARLKNISEAVFKHSLKSFRTRALASPFMETIGGFAIMIIVLYGGAQVIEGTRTAGTFFSFITALLLAYEPMKKLSALNANIQEGLVAASRVFAVLEMNATILDPVSPVELKEVKGHIEFKNVSFSYKEGGDSSNKITALSKVSLSIKPGMTVALVGPSGAGKSTLMNLLPRFYDVESGHILLEGHDIKNLRLSDLRSHMALVTQEVTLFDETIAENIRYGHQEASEDLIIKAAKAAAAHDFIKELPDGYQTVVGEQGIKLSGGQRQRLAIARAILRDAPILLLDEATSALDTQSERAVQKALKNLMKNRTSLIIAHRLSTVQNADLICVLDQGRLVEQGTHRTLLDKKGIYHTLYTMQYFEEDQDHKASQESA